MKQSTQFALILGMILISAAFSSHAAKPTIKCDGQETTIVGTQGADVIIGTDEDDVIHALGGNDEVSAGLGNDVICGGSGDEGLNGQGDDDRIFDGPGDDRLENIWGQSKNSPSVTLNFYSDANYHN